MKRTHEGLYVGTVMHRRFRPKLHHFKYSVFTLFADIDALPALGRRLALFSHNRFNLFSMHDKDFGDGQDLKPHLVRIADAAVGRGVSKRFLVLGYPRVLGYVFNPLTVYFGLDSNDNVAVTIYEVSNTFGERHSYAMATNAGPGDVIRHSCGKEFHVSPFNKVEGRYLFRTALPGELAAIGIRLEHGGKPLLAAHFSGVHRPITNRQLLTRFVVNAFMTQKVWLAIRWEALRLWLRGLPVFKKPAPPTRNISVENAGIALPSDDLAA